MLADLLVAFPFLRPLLTIDPDLAAVLYPPAAFTADERAAQVAALTATTVAQPALGVCGLAMTQLLATLDIHPDTTPPGTATASWSRSGRLGSSRPTRCST